MEHTQPGCTSQPGSEPDPGERNPVWQLGWRWSETLQHLLKKKEQTDAADRLCWTTKCSESSLLSLLGLCAVIGGASWTRAA